MQTLNQHPPINFTPKGEMNGTWFNVTRCTYNGNRASARSSIRFIPVLHNRSSNGPVGQWATLVLLLPTRPGHLPNFHWTRYPLCTSHQCATPEVKGLTAAGGETFYPRLTVLLRGTVYVCVYTYTRRCDHRVKLRRESVTWRVMRVWDR